MWCVQTTSTGPSFYSAFDITLQNVRAPRLERELSGVGLQDSRRIRTACFGLGHVFFEFGSAARFGGVCSALLELGTATNAKPA